MLIKVNFLQPTTTLCFLILPCLLPPPPGDGRKKTIIHHAVSFKHCCFQNYDHRPKSMEMHLRKLRMLQTCKKYGDVLKAPEMLAKRNTLIWDLTDHLIYCRIAKVSGSVTAASYL